MSTREQSCGDVTLQSSTRVACGGRGQALQPARPSCKPQARAGQQPGCCRVSGAGGAQLGRRRALLQPLQDGSPWVGSAVARAGGSWSCSLVQPCGPGPRQWPHLAARAQAPPGRTPPWHPRVNQGPREVPAPGSGGGIAACGVRAGRAPAALLRLPALQHGVQPRGW